MKWVLLRRTSFHKTTEALKASEKAVPTIKRIKNFQKNFKDWLEWIRLVILSLVGLVIIIVLVYNMFASSEKDVPDAVIEKLYKIIQSQPIIAINGETEWRNYNFVAKNIILFLRFQNLTLNIRYESMKNLYDFFFLAYTFEGCLSKLISM